MASYQQDLPPKDGFEKVEWAARKAKRLMSGRTQIGIFVVFTGCAWIHYKIWKANLRKEQLEMHETRIAVQPFLSAERDRAYLKHVRRNRDEENELMKNVEGWKTGTLYGEPVFHNVRDRFKKASYRELLVHMSPQDQHDFTWFKMTR
uniref:NADH dehydrogenase [ubiquinone] 1 alpha subcomplex subunit 13 n=1 Tax=Arion vulgaris TaxID=1028688 RepID=A0A0B6ZDC1_9EUPU